MKIIANDSALLSVNMPKGNELSNIVRGEGYLII